MTLLERKQPMTIEEFLAFAEARPDGERWELIDGEPVLSPSPSYDHQKIVGNLYFALRASQTQAAGWEVLPGIGVKLSDTGMPVPHLLIRPHRRISGHFCDDMIIAFEVLSPSSRGRDSRWKRQAYANLPSLEQYVVVHQDEVAVRSYRRLSGWAEKRLTSLGERLDLAAIVVSLPMRALYHDTGL